MLDYIPFSVFTHTTGMTHFQAIRRVQVNQDGLKLNGTHQFLAYANDVNIFGGSAHTIKKNAEALLVATKEFGLEVNADKTKHMILSQDQNAGLNHSKKIDNSSIETN